MVKTAASRPFEVKDHAARGDEFLRLASRAFLARDFDVAADHVRKARELQPSSVEAYSWQARVAAKRESWDELVEAAELLLSHSGDNAQALQFRARGLSSLGRWNEAVAAWELFLKIETDNIDALTHLCVALFHSGRIPQAAKTIARLRNLALEDLKILSLAAQTAARSGLLGTSLELYTELAAHDPESVTAMLAGHLGSGDLRGAACALAALGVDSLEDPDEAQSVTEALISDGVAFERMGTCGEALMDYIAASMLSPADPLVLGGVTRVREAMTAQVNAALAAGNHEEVSALCNYLVRATPSDADVLKFCAQASALRGDVEAATAEWLGVLEQSPQDTMALAALANLAEGRGEYDVALTHWRTLVSADPKSREARRQLEKLPGRILTHGKALVASGMYVEAVVALQAVPAANAALWTDSRRRLEQVGRYLLRDMRLAYREGRFDDVIDLSTSLASIDPDNIDGLRLTARSAMKLKRYDVALEAWTSLNRLESDTAATLVGIARCQIALLNWPAANDAVTVVERNAPGGVDSVKLRSDLARKMSRA